MQQEISIKKRRNYKERKQQSQIQEGNSRTRHAKEEIIKKRGCKTQEKLQRKISKNEAQVFFFGYIIE